MSEFKPFDNDSQSITIGKGNGITFENGKDEITIYGDTSINKNSDPNTIDILLEILTEIKANLTQTKDAKIKKP
jgi:hypothetical protein